MKNEDKEIYVGEDRYIAATHLKEVLLEESKHLKKVIAFLEDVTEGSYRFNRMIEEHKIRLKQVRWLYNKLGLHEA